MLLNALIGYQVPFTLLNPWDQLNKFLSKIIFQEYHMKMLELIQTVKDKTELSKQEAIDVAKLFILSLT